jgi:hypothetical protein
MIDHRPVAAVCVSAALPRADHLVRHRLGWPCKQDAKRPERRLLVVSRRVGLITYCSNSPIQSHICYGLLSSGRVWSRFRCGSRYERLASALEAERGGTRVSEGDSRNWAAAARDVSDRILERGWRRRELAKRSHPLVAVVPEIQRPASLLFPGILLSAPASKSGTLPFPREALMRFQDISSATDPGSARSAAHPVRPRCESLVRRFTGRCGCR